MTRKRILFVSENVTLAQVVRLVELARTLDPRRYEVHYACSEFDPLVFGDTAFTRHVLPTIARERVFRALASGKRLYEKRTLREYVRDELALFERVQPDLVVGDFRLSLGISAPAAGIRLATMINAYWSPYATREHWPVPDHPIVRLLGEEVAGRYFPQAVPKVFAHFASPVNAVRKQYGLPPIGSLLDVLTHGDATLYPDVPELVPTRDLPSSHRYLGPVVWTPRVAPPRCLDRDDRPWIYVTLGSSGNVDVLPAVLEAVRGLKAHVLLATARRADLPIVPSNVLVTDFVPGDLAARRAALVVSNGGSSTGYQALAEGTPVLGIASNFDQFLAMDAIQTAGAGVTLRASTVTADSVRDGILRIARDPEYRSAAHRIAEAFGRTPCASRFPRFVEEATGASLDGHRALDATA